jgi:diguanylate cyclase (GGDEF)-like protein/PAS domain S-box-containing protein
MSISVPTVLIVDDDAKNRRLLAVLLHPQGYETASAASGAEALSKVAGSPPDLILLDLSMPGIDGYQVASILKKNPATANIPIIMLTGEEEIDARRAGLEAGAEEFLTKPVDRTELRLRVANLLRLKELEKIEEHCFTLEQQVKARSADLQRFRMAMNATADAIMLISRDSQRFVEVNNTSCKMLGYSRAEMLTLGPVALGAITRDELEQLFATAIDGQEALKLSEVSLRCKDGSLVHVEINRQAMLSGNEWIIVSVVRDISERKQAQQSLQYQANHDVLTGLPNRAFYYETLRHTLSIAAQNNWTVAVMIIDLDHFKNVNDTLGHAVGDELLLQFSNRLVTCVHAHDTVARLGGDEFGLMLVMEIDHQGAAPVAAKIGAVLEQPFNLQGYEVIMTASIGITVHPEDGNDLDTLIKYADTAMYQAKHAGRNTYRFFTAQMNIAALQRQDLESALRKAIDNSEFNLYYQPKVMLTSDAIVGFEALLRWNRPGHGPVSPALFVPVLEETGLIVQVGRWVIDTACRQIKLWQAGPEGPVQVSVNVSGRQFVDGDLETNVADALVAHDIPGELLELEITETSLMVNTDRTVDCLRNLGGLGVKVSVDDFGTGYSSLAYLRRFPIDKLKIDIAFIRDITTNLDDAAIVNAIITMAHSLNLEVIAEGVETAAQRDYLTRCHCDQIQGFLISQPLSSGLATTFMALRPRTASATCDVTI